MKKANEFVIAVRKFDPFESAIEKIWKSFQEYSGCDMTLKAIPLELGDLHATLFGNSDIEWDVGHVVTDWLSEASNANILLDLSANIKEESSDFFSAWPDSLQKMQTFKDQVLGLPFHNGPECLIYRKDLFEENQDLFRKCFNKDLTPPKTWSDFIDVAYFFHRPEQNLYGTTFAMFPDGHNTVFDFCIQLWSRGGQLINNNGEITINTEEVINGLKFYRQITNDTNAIHPDSKSFDSVKSGIAFSKGEVAMMVNWFGFATMCETLQDSKVKGKVDIAAIPGSDGNVGKCLNVYWVYGVSSKSKQPEIAYEFIKHATSPKNDKLLSLEGGIGCRYSTWEDEELNKIIPYYHQLSNLHNEAKTLPRMQVWNEIAHIIDELVMNAVSSDNSISIQNLVENAQEKINNLS